MGQDRTPPARQVRAVGRDRPRQPPFRQRGAVDHPPVHPVVRCRGVGATAGGRRGRSGHGVADSRRDARQGAQARGGGRRGPRASALQGGGGGTKIHLAVDSLGLPLRVSVTAGTVADCSQTLPLISGLRAGHLLADRGYDSDEIVDGAAAMGMVPVIPPRSNRRAKRKYDRYLYRVCHLVENAFLRMKEWRGIATRHAKRLSSFLAFIHLRCAVMWLK